VTPRIALATCRALPALFEDDHPLVEALASEGVRAEPAVWDEAVRWSEYDAVVLRSVWDYHLQAQAFETWLGELEAGSIPCWNPVSLVRWNLDKRYLRELEAKGIATVPTLWVDRGVSAEEAAARIAATGWADLVVKPTVSAGAWRTVRMAGDGVPGRVDELRSMLAEGGVMVQPFVPEILEEGEHSLLFFDGDFSHAVLKRPRSGDFRVQWVHGGDHVATAPSRSIVEQAAAVLAAAPSPGLYARVDGVIRGGRLILMELEQIEPYLFLSEGPGAAERLARAVRARV